MVNHKVHELNDNWDLKAHQDYKLFTSNDNKNEYILIDYENTVLLQFIVQQESFEVAASSWDIRYKVTRDREIFILTEPEVFDEDEDDED